jgi:predicted enzyme related to lactoylglutathione lyase
MRTDLKFGGVVVYVRDAVPGILEFYRRAFGIETRHYDPAYEYGELETGGPPVAFGTARTAELLRMGSYKPPVTDSPPCVEIAFITGDVAAAFKRAVDAGAVAVAEPYTLPWGQTVAYIRSIAGTLVGLCSPIAG